MVMLERTLVLWIPSLAEGRDDIAGLRMFASCLAIVMLRCPFVEPLRLGLMALPLRSVLRFFGGEEQVCTLFRNDLEPVLNEAKLGLHIGIADGLFAAVLAASREERVPSGETQAFLDSQAISRLHRSEVAELCERLGVRTLGAFAKLDRDRVLERFGPDAVHCHRVARGEESELNGIRDTSLLRRLALLEAPETSATQVGFFGGTSARDERAQRTAIRLQEHFGVASVQVALTQAGRDPAERMTLTAFAAQERPTLRDSAPWPARLPTPSPTTVFSHPRDVLLLGEQDRPIDIDGVGLLTSEPRHYVETGSRSEVAAWAGPWPVTGPWWRQHFRRNRLQILTRSGCALLLSHEGQRWKLVGRYD